MPPIRRRGKRGPYKMHLRDPAIPMARTTEWLRRTTEERLQRERQEQNQMLANVDVVQEIDFESGDEESSVLSDSEAGSSFYESEVRSSSADGFHESPDVELNGSAESGDPPDSISSAFSCASSESGLSHAESDEVSVFALGSDVEPGTEDENDSSSSISALSVVSSSSSGSDEEEHPFMQDIRQQVLIQHEEHEGRDGANQILYQQENIERQPLYLGAQISKEESDILIMSFIIRWGLEEKGTEDLLRLIDCHLPASTLGSKYTFLKKFPTPPTMKVRYFCPECSGLLPSDMDEVQCDCGYVCVLQEMKDAGSDFFVQLSISDQIRQIMSNRKLVELLRKECQESDVINGKVYKRLRNKGVIADNDLTIQFNCDGVKPFKSSKVSIYPVQACINEMPFRQRRDNMILCGLFYGKKKPNINAFLKPFVDEMEHLHSEGVDCEVPGHDAVMNVKVHTLLSSVDSVARPTLQGIKQFNGRYGCSFCLRRGRQIERGRGRARVYVGVQGQPRTLQQHIEALERLNNYNQTHREKKDHVEGVKQATVLLLLPIFNIIKSFVPDYLHSALEGVVSTFLKFWMSSSESKGKDWHLDKEKVRLLNARLLAIKPPVEVTRAPRDISQLALWKASELRSFLLYYSLVCLKGLLPNKFLRHWFLFVQSMTVFLKEKISPDEFVKAKAALTKFVEDIEVIYPNYPSLYTFNVHLLLHIPKAVDDFGALWASSTFPYEHFNGVLARLIKGTQSVPQQICRSYLRLRRLWFLSAQAFSGYDFSERAKELYESMLGKSYSSHLSQQFDNGLRLFGASEHYHLSLVEKVTVQHHLGFDVQDFAESYRRMIYQSTVYHASAYNALIVRNNSIVKLNAGGFLIIDRILVVQKTNCAEKFCIITGEILDIVDEELVYDRELEIYSSSFIHICQRNDRILACYPQQIAAKCVGVPHGNAICVIALVNNLERD